MYVAGIAFDYEDWLSTSKRESLNPDPRLVAVFKDSPPFLADTSLHEYTEHERVDVRSVKETAQLVLTALDLLGHNACSHFFESM
ncbi:hypothetical protein [Brevibacillus nitrificans]|uniref:hypothetical protein n=1 Tax=Brevibacillus nitrificans TaxID=651560 RepID=UPI00285FF845|nr:hypothetical protein [Brevibacillus nitrificans]MDR7316614.1 hypothetical protein [Brevibacillus nitrificans]